MTREEWQRVKDILHNALDVPRAARPRFLDEACNGDTALRGEVESLLASHDEAGTFIEEPMASAPKLTPPPPDSLGVGADLGPYRIVQLIAEQTVDQWLTDQGRYSSFFSVLDSRLQALGPFAAVVIVGCSTMDMSGPSATAKLEPTKGSTANHLTNGIAPSSSLRSRPQSRIRSWRGRTRTPRCSPR